MLGRQLVLEVPGGTVRTALPNPFGFGGFGGQAIQVTIDGPDPDTLNALVAQVTQVVEQIPGVADVNNSNQRVLPEYDVNIDRNRAADLGIYFAQVRPILRICRCSRRTAGLRD